MQSKLEGHFLIGRLNILSTSKNRWKDKGCKASLQSSLEIQKHHQRLENKNKAIVEVFEESNSTFTYKHLVSQKLFKTCFWYILNT